MTEIESLSLWDEPAEQVTAQRTASMKRLAEAAVEPLWPYLSAASTQTEFEHRMGMVEGGIRDRVLAATGSNSAEQEARRHLLARWDAVVADRTANVLRTAGLGFMLAGDGMTAEVMAYPQCQICQKADAHWDGKTVYGPWAYMCDSCHDSVGLGQGMGVGQKLVLAPSSKESAKTAASLGGYDEGYALGKKHADGGKGYHLPFGQSVDFVQGYNDGYDGTPKKTGAKASDFKRGDEVEVWGRDGTEHAVVDEVNDAGVVVRYHNSETTETIDPGRLTPVGDGRYSRTDFDPHDGFPYHNGSKTAMPLPGDDRLACPNCNGTMKGNDDLVTCTDCGRGAIPAALARDEGVNYFIDDHGIARRKGGAAESKSAAMTAAYLTQTQSPVHADPEGYERFMTGSLQTTAVAWARRHYEDLAEAIGSLPDGEREKAAHHFAEHLKGTNPNYRPEQFEQAASTKGYRARGGTGTPDYTRGHFQSLADAVKSYDGDKQGLSSALTSTFRRSNPRFDADRFLKATSGAKVAWTPDGSDLTPGANRLLDLQGQAYDAIGVNGFAGPDDPKRRQVIDWIKAHLGNVASYTQDDIDLAEDYNAHAAVQAVMEAQGTWTTGSQHTAAFGAGTFEMGMGPLRGFLESEIGAMRFPDTARMTLTIDGRVYTISLVLETATGDDGFKVHGDVSGYYAVWFNRAGQMVDLGGNQYISPGKPGGPQQAYAARNTAELIANNAKILMPDDEGDNFLSHKFSVTVALARDPYTASLHTAWTDAQSGAATWWCPNCLYEFANNADADHAPKCPKCGTVGASNVDPGAHSASLHTADYKYVHQRGDKWVITQKGTGKVLSTHDSEEKAKAAFRAMMQSKHGGQSAVQALLQMEADGQHVNDEDEDEYRRQMQEDYDDYWRDQPGAIQSSLHEAAEGDERYPCHSCGTYMTFHKGKPSKCPECGLKYNSHGVPNYDTPKKSEAGRGLICAECGHVDDAHSGKWCENCASEQSSKNPAHAFVPQQHTSAVAQLLATFLQDTEGEDDLQRRHQQYWDAHPDEYAEHLRQNASRRQAAATCPDCGGPLVQAFDTTDNYERCTRCGHVFPAAHVEQNSSMGSRREAAAGDACYHPRSCPQCDSKGSACGRHHVGDSGHERCRGNGQKQAVNDSAYGTDRYQHLDAPAKPSWITEWADQEMKATKEMTEQGLNAYVPPNPFPNLTTLQQIRNLALKQAADDFDGFSEVGEIPETDTNAATGTDETTPMTTKPRQVPKADEGPHMVTVDQQIIPPDPMPQMGQGQAEPQMGSGGGFDMGYAPTQDPMQPTPEQMVAAKVARLAQRIELDNPSMSREESRRLAAMTVAKHPEMVKVQR